MTKKRKRKQKPKPKPTLVLADPFGMTAEEYGLMFEKLTGRKPSAEGMEKLRREMEMPPEYFDNIDVFGD